MDSFLIAQVSAWLTHVINIQQSLLFVPPFSSHKCIYLYIHSLLYSGPLREYLLAYYVLDDGHSFQPRPNREEPLKLGLLLFLIRTNRGLIYY